MKTNVVVLLLHADDLSDDGYKNLKGFFSEENTGVGN